MWDIIEILMILHRILLLYSVSSISFYIVVLRYHLWSNDTIVLSPIILIKDNGNAGNATTD